MAGLEPSGHAASLRGPGKFICHAYGCRLRGNLLTLMHGWLTGTRSTGDNLRDGEFNLVHVHGLARSTGHLERFLVFGSFVTAKPDPNDVDVILVMDDHFRLEACPIEARGLFDHAVAQARCGASIFWTRPSILIGETVDEFLAHWQIKRENSRRGIVEVVP